MRLINADELQEKLDYTINVAESMHRKTFELKGLKKIVDDIPTTCDVDKVRTDAIDDFMKALCSSCKKQPCYEDECYQKKLTEQLKEKK